MSFHADVMPAAQQLVLRQLAPLAGDAGFYLAGGTAVAIHVGHRRSVDFDWFTHDWPGEPIAFATTLRDAGFAFETAGVDTGTLHGSSNGVLLSFLEYRYPLLRPIMRWPEFNCSIASLEDLACMKLSALANRGAKKDFIDVYALGVSGISLPTMLDLYRSKYSVDDIGHVVMSLTYFDDAEAEDMPQLLSNTDWRTVKATLEDWVNDYGPTA